MNRSCPACLVLLPESPQMVGGLTVCQNPVCARTLVQVEDYYALATGAETMSLTDGQRNQLRAMRPKAWRENRKAEIAAIRGRR
jgi:hypothetical protein